MEIERWRGGATGRSRSVAAGETVWTVANTIDPSPGFEAQAALAPGLLVELVAVAARVPRS